MREILPQNSLFSVLIGAQPVKEDAAYRLASFCLLTEADGVPLAYNSLTSELLELDGNTADRLRRGQISGDGSTASLIEKWFLVPTSHDDVGFVREVRTLMADLRRDKGLDFYTIYTTTDCNARCFYCFELSAKRTPMTAQVAKDAAEFILRTHGDRKIKLQWYGGEPLYNAEVIDIISDTLTEAGVEFESSMITNGYLLDDAFADKFCGSWHCKKAQITLDGTEDVYNKAKAFIYNDGRSPFKVVTDNIERLLKRGVQVAIRMNLGEHNAEDLYRLVDWIDARYPDRKGLHVYPYLLFDTAFFDPMRGTAEADVKAVQMRRAEELLRLEQYCTDKGLRKIGKLEREPRLTRCMIDSGSSVTILPDGKIGKCDHLLTDSYVGTVYDGITDTEKIAELTDPWFDSGLCGTCPAFPVCVRLKHCPAEGRVPCDESKRHIAVTHLARRVQAAYRKEINKKE